MKDLRKKLTAYAISSWSSVLPGFDRLGAVARDGRKLARARNIAALQLDAAPATLLAVLAENTASLFDLSSSESKLFYLDELLRMPACLLPHLLPRVFAANRTPVSGTH